MIFFGYIMNIVTTTTSVHDPLSDDQRNYSQWHHVDRLQEGLVS